MCAAAARAARRWAKLAPNVTDLPAIAAAALDAGADGLTLVNTVMGLVVDPATRPPGPGRRGGRAVRARRCSPIARARRSPRSPPRIPGVPIVGIGGVTTGLDAVEMLLAGAAAVGVGTATFADPRAAPAHPRRARALVRPPRRHARRRPDGALRPADREEPA